MDYYFSLASTLYNRFWGSIAETGNSTTPINDTNITSPINDTNVTSPIDDAKARRAAFLSYFLNDTKPCDKYEVLYLKHLYTCPVPIEIAPDYSRYYPFIIILMLLMGVSLLYVMKRRSRILIRRNLAEERNMNSIATVTTVLVVGANQTGKKSVISSFKNIYPESNTWNFLTQHFSKYRIPNSFIPDVIWLVVNYQGSIHENELKILEHADDIPVVLVINKVDLLQEINLNDDNIIKNFDERVPSCLEKYERLMNIRKRLLQLRTPMVILSLRQEEDNDRDIGMNNLIEITNEYLLKETLGNNLFHYDGVQHQLNSIRNNAEIRKRNIRVLLIGYTSTGKSSLINFFAGNSVAPVSFDGLPVTQDIHEYVLSDLNLILIDSMGLEKKRDNTEKLKKLKECYQPDFIWFLVNYQSSIEEDELNLINELFSLIPTIIVVNFMDILQTLDHNIDFETDTHRQDQIEIQRLLKFKQNQTNVQHIIAISLRSEEQDDKPRGLELLYQKTIEHF